MNVQLCGWKKRGKKVLFISSRGAVRLMWQLNKIEDDAVLQVHFWHNSQQFPVEHKSITARSSIKLCRLPYDVWCIMSMWCRWCDKTFTASSRPCKYIQSSNRKAIWHNNNNIYSALSALLLSPSRPRWRRFRYLFKFLHRFLGFT